MLCLLQLPGKKDLFIEADLMSPLDRIANVSILKVPCPHSQVDQAPLSSLSSFSFDEWYKLLRSNYYPSRVNTG